MNFYQLNEALENGIGYRVFCDLDGVLVDLERGLADHYGIPAGFSAERFQELFDGLEDSEADLEGFFADLHWKRDGRELWENILPYEPMILTAASHHRDPHIVAGKYDWCRRHLKLPKSRVIMESQKYIYAAPNHVLIDDTPEKIRGWTNAGGLGILHRSAGESIHDLKRIFLTKKRGKIEL